MRLTCKPINVVAQSDESVVRPKIDEPNKRSQGLRMPVNIPNCNDSCVHFLMFFGLRTVQYDSFSAASPNCS